MQLTFSKNLLSCVILMDRYYKGNLTDSSCFIFLKMGGNLMLAINLIPLISIV